MSSPEGSAAQPTLSQYWAGRYRADVKRAFEWLQANNVPELQRQIALQDLTPALSAAQAAWKGLCGEFRSRAHEAELTCQGRRYELLFRGTASLAVAEEVEEVDVPRGHVLSAMRSLEVTARLLPSPSVGFAPAEERDMRRFLTRHSAGHRARATEALQTAIFNNLGVVSLEGRGRLVNDYGINLGPCHYPEEFSVPSMPPSLADSGLFLDTFDSRHQGETATVYAVQAAASKWKDGLTTDREEILRATSFVANEVEWRPLA